MLSPSAPKTLHGVSLWGFLQVCWVLRLCMLQDLSNSRLGSGIQSQFAAMEIPAGFCVPALLGPRARGLAPKPRPPHPQRWMTNSANPRYQLRPWAASCTMTALEPTLASASYTETVLQPGAVGGD